MYAQVGLCEAFRPFLVIGFAPQKVARAHCGQALDAERARFSRPLIRWRCVALLVARGALVVTHATLVGARATLRVTSCRFCQKVSRL